MSDPVARKPEPVPTGCRAGCWQVALLGRVEARNGDLLITRFNSHPTAALLARLALYPQRLHPREELAELLWPNAPPQAGRNRLRQALSTLRRLLEPAGQGGPPVFMADRQGVRVNPAALGCDALEFERCLQQGQWARAQELYVGELMPGHYDNWVEEERRRLAALQEGLAGRLQVLPSPLPNAATVLASSATPTAAAPLAPPLPSFLTRFFGRQAETTALVDAVAASRLVTLTGVGGCGKTRLALEAAQRAGDFERVVFVPLADCSNTAQALAQLRASLQITAGKAEPLEQIAQALSQRAVLLVLDNFEQLVASGGDELVRTLLARCSGLHLLVTSRRVLGLGGEHEQPLAPLPLPLAGAPFEALASNPGVAMFVDRARGVRPEFALTQRNAETLAALCRALEGVPLAIELAAARSRVFSLRELHDALARPLLLLERTGARAGHVPRHDSLRGAIDWSWRLLDPVQQRFLAALSVFRGGWSVVDAQAVCGDADAPHAHELIEVLLEHSLLTAELGPDGGMRFRMLELIREFVTGQLDAERGQALRSRHRAHVLSIAQGLQASGKRAMDAEELPNVQQAMRTAVQDGQPEVALRLGTALRSHWDSQGIDPEQLAMLSQAAAAASAGSPALAPACTMLATLLLTAGDLHAAHDMAERALGLAGDQPVLRAAALCAWVQVVADGERRYAGLGERLQEALRLAQGHDELLAQVTALQGTLAARDAEDPVAAEAFFDQAAGHWLAAGRVREARLLRYDRALCLCKAGQLALALRQAELCERECAAIGERARRVAAINLQGVILALQRRWGDAVQAYRRCVAEAWVQHQHYWLSFALWNHGRNLARLRQPEAAARLMAFSENHWTSHFGPLTLADERHVRRVRRLVACQLGAAQLRLLWAEGAQLTLHEAVHLATHPEPAGD